MSKFLAILLISLSAFAAGSAAQARDTKTDKIFPKYQQRPILALLSSEQLETPANRVGILLDRTARICSFLNLPAGSFRARRAEKIITMGFAHDGKMAALEKQSNGSINPRLLAIAKTEQPEVVKSMVCVGSN